MDGTQAGAHGGAVDSEGDRTTHPKRKQLRWDTLKILGWATRRRSEDPSPCVFIFNTLPSKYS
jgi:hypothetical protein